MLLDGRKYQQYYCTADVSEALKQVEPVARDVEEIAGKVREEPESENSRNAVVDMNVLTIPPNDMPPMNIFITALAIIYAVIAIQTVLP